MNLRKKLNISEVTIGGWVTLGNSGIAEIFSRAGYDWVVVDLEHSVITLEAAGDMIRAIDLCGSIPLVRLTSNDPNQVKRVLDAGAKGIIVPMVMDKQEAEMAVKSTKYGPEGIRGVGLGRAQGYGAKFQEYLQWQNEEGPVVIVQIEHKDAIKNIDEILSVKGIDAFIIGPYDLSCSMGIPGQFEHVDFQKGLKDILNAGKKLKVPAGIHIVEPDVLQLEDRIKEGYQFIAYGVDIRILDHGVRSGLNRVKKAKS